MQAGPGSHPDVGKAAPPGAPTLSLEGIEKAFGATVALGGLALQVAAGEVVALMGANGAGKSTLVFILSGAIRHDRVATKSGRFF